MVKIWFGRPGTQPDQSDLKGEMEISDRLPKMPDEESLIPLLMRNYKSVVVEIEEENGDLKSGYYFSTLTSKEVWEKF